MQVSTHLAAKLINRVRLHQPTGECPRGNSWLTPSWMTQKVQLFALWSVCVSKDQNQIKEEKKCFWVDYLWSHEERCWKQPTPNQPRRGHLHLDKAWKNKYGSRLLQGQKQTGVHEHWQIFLDLRMEEFGKQCSSNLDHEQKTTTENPSQMLVSDLFVIC